MAHAVKRIPDGYHTLTPYLNIRDCARAIEFYKAAFGAEELFRMPGPEGKIMHAELRIGDSPLMLSEEFPDFGVRSPATLNGTASSTFLYVEDVDAVWNRALKAGATEVYPLKDQFWGDRFGKLRDPFGHEWGLASHVEDVSPEEMARRQAEMKCGQ